MNENAWTEIVQILFQAYTEIDMDDDFYANNGELRLSRGKNRGWIMHGMKGNFLFIDTGGNLEMRERAWHGHFWDN